MNQSSGSTWQIRQTVSGVGADLKSGGLRGAWRLRPSLASRDVHTLGGHLVKAMARRGLGGIFKAC